MRQPLLSVFTLGLVAGGSTTSVALWLASGLIQWASITIRLTFVVLLGIAITLRELHVISFPLPQNKRQVPPGVFNKGVTVAALQFGFELGTGVRTYVSSGAPYVMGAGVLLLAGGLSDAVLAGVGFGLGRAIMAIIRYWSPNGAVWDERMERHLRWLLPATSSICAVAAFWVGLRW